MNPDPWLNVTEPAFFKELNARLSQESLKDLKTYLRWAVADANCALPRRHRSSTRSFAFYRKYLRGVEADRPRWKKCVAWVDRDLGEALGREFVARTFPAAAKEKTVTDDAADRGGDEGAHRAARLDVAGDEGAGASRSSSKVRNKVGYPRSWRDYSALTIERSDFFENVSRALRFETGGRRRRSASRWIAASGACPRLP